MNLPQKVSVWLFLKIVTRKLIALDKFETEYTFTMTALPMHKEYTKLLKGAELVNDRYISLQTLVKFIRHKLSYIEDKVNAEV